MQDTTAIQSALEIFYAAEGFYPEVLWDQANKKTDLVPKQMPKMALDPVTGKEYTYKTGDNKTKYQVAVTLDNGDGTYTAFVVGNSGTDIITSGWKFTSSPSGSGTWSQTNCTVKDDGDCVPYKIEN